MCLFTAALVCIGATVLGTGVVTLAYVQEKLNLPVWVFHTPKTCHSCVVLGRDEKMKD